MSYGKIVWGTAPYGATAAAEAEITELLETLAFSTGTAVQVDTVLAELLSLAQSTNTQVDTVLMELLSLAQSIDPKVSMSAELTELLALSGRLTPVSEGVIAEVLELAETVDGTYLAYAALVDTLLLTAATETTVAAMGVISEVLALRDVLTSVQDGDVTDLLTFAQATEERISWYEALVSSAVFADENLGQASVTVLISDTIVLDETADPRVSLVAAIQDELDFSVGFVFDDTPYVAYSMTAATKALSSYTNFAFDSMASFKGRVYAAGEGGLYRLGGDTDAGTAIPWRIRTGLSNLGTGRQKGMDAAYLGYTATGRIILKCIVVAPTGEKKAYLYEMSPSGGSAKPGRILTGRGLRSVYWGFELTNIDAGDIELDTLELHPVVFEGRVP